MTPGSNIGKYKITRLVGEGGMASVYEAVHEVLGNKVAIKILNPLLSSNAQIRERFLNEARLMASLDHPNITKVVDFDETSAQLSIVMEFLQGQDLGQLIKNQGSLKAKQLESIFCQALAALQYAHEKGIVHRDIKPSNIFILPNGHVKILDFGIAKIFGQGNEMTQTGTQIGTPVYMSPEQVRAEKSIDFRSDIYSLGVTLYYATEGKPPYNPTTESSFDIFTKIVHEPLPQLAGDPRLNAIIEKACQKNRELRFQSCLEFEQALKKEELAKDSTWYDADRTRMETNHENNIVLPTPSEKQQTSTPVSKHISSNQANIIKILNTLLIVGSLLFIGSFFYLKERYFKGAAFALEGHAHKYNKFALIFSSLYFLFVILANAILLGLKIMPLKSMSIFQTIMGISLFGFNFIIYESHGSIMFYESLPYWSICALFILINSIIILSGLKSMIKATNTTSV